MIIKMMMMISVRRLNTIWIQDNCLIYREKYYQVNVSPALVIFMLIFITWRVLGCQRWIICSWRWVCGISFGIDRKKNEQWKMHAPYPSVCFCFCCCCCCCCCFFFCYRCCGQWNRHPAVKKKKVKKKRHLKSKRRTGKKNTKRIITFYDVS